MMVKRHSHHYLPKPTFSDKPLTTEQATLAWYNLQHQVRCVEHSLIDIKQEMLRLRVLGVPPSTTINQDSEIYYPDKPN